MRKDSWPTATIAVLFAGFACSCCLAQAPDPVQARAVYSFPPVGEYQVLVGDFHAHTTYSDGRLSPAERVLEAYRAGYDVIAITDHGNLQAYGEVSQLAESLGLVLLRGVETGLRGAEHLVALGVDANYKPRGPHDWALTIEEAAQTGRVYYRNEMRAIARSGGVLLYAHPHVGWREPVQWGVENGFIVGLEVFNSVVGDGWNTVRSHGLSCYPFAFDWARERRLGVFANSDIHGAQESSPPRGRNLVLVTERSPQGVMEAIRQRRVLAWLPAGQGGGESEPMLWAPQALLTTYVGATVQVQLRELAGPGQFAGTMLRNLGALPLQARVSLDGKPLSELSLRPGQEYLLRHTQVLAALTVEWLNLWATPQDTLITKYRAVYRGGRRIWLPQTRE